MTSTDNLVESPISIAIFDVTGITSDLLQRVFSKQPEYHVVGCPRTIDEAIRNVIEMQPDTVIVSVFEETGSHIAIQFLEELSFLGSSSRAIVLSAHLTSDETVAYFRAQARGVLSGSTADFAVLSKCIACVHSGQIWANSEQLVCLIQALSPSRDLAIVNASGLPILSSREEEVLRLLAEGLSNRELAEMLKLSEHTVRNHLFHIFDKLGVSSRMEAVVYAFSHRKGDAQFMRSSRPREKMPSRRNEIAVNE